jgi:hypothetical protein
VKNALAAMFCASALGLFVGTAFAQDNREAEMAATPEALERVYSCTETASDAERLACYDASVRALREAQTGGQVVALDRGNVERIQRQSFGFSLPAVDRLLPRFGHEDGTLERVDVTVQRMSVGASGRTTFYMTDGQVWTQVDADPVRNVRVGDNVSIRRAAMGSFMLSPSRNGMGHRIRRVS